MHDVLLSHHVVTRQIANDLDSRVSELVSNVTNMIGSGSGLRFFEMAVKLRTENRSIPPPAAILARLAMMKPVKGRDRNNPFSDVELEQLKELKEAIGSSEEFEPFKEYFTEFGNEKFIDSIKESMAGVIEEGGIDEIGS